MSSYITFFLKRKQDESVISFLSYSRSSHIYQIMNAPYGSAHLVTESMVLDAIDAVDDSITSLQRMRERKEKNLSLISTFNNSIQEKIDLIDEGWRAVDEILEEISDFENARSALVVLMQILDDLKYGSDNTELWCGIDVDPEFFRKENLKNP